MCIYKKKIVYAEYSYLIISHNYYDVTRTFFIFFCEWLGVKPCPQVLTHPVKMSKILGCTLWSDSNSNPFICVFWVSNGYCHFVYLYKKNDLNPCEQLKPLRNIVLDTSTNKAKWRDEGRNHYPNVEPCVVSTWLADQNMRVQIVSLILSCILWITYINVLWVATQPSFKSVITFNEESENMDFSISSTLSNL